MKTKKIVLGSIIAVCMLVMVPSLSAVEYKTPIKQLKEKIAEKTAAATSLKLENLVLVGGIAFLIIYIGKHFNDIKTGEGLIENIKEITFGGTVIIVSTLGLFLLFKNLLGRAYSPPPP